MYIKISSIVKHIEKQKKETILYFIMNETLDRYIISSDSLMGFRRRNKRRKKKRLQENMN